MIHSINPMVLFGRNPDDKTARIAGNPLELSLPRSKNMKDSAISSESYLMELVSKTAYSIGAVLGDGSMRFIPGYGNGSWYQVELACMDVEIVERFLGEVNKVFGSTYKWFTRKTKKGTTMYHGRTSRKDIYDYFFSITLCKHFIPMDIIRSTDEVKRDLVAGLFDTDGTVKFTETWNGSKTKKNPRWQLGFSNTKRAIVESLAVILRSLGVDVGKIQKYERNSYLTIYTIHPNLRSFIDSGCYFTASRKHKRIINYLDHVGGSETMYAAPSTHGDDIVQH